MKPSRSIVAACIALCCLMSCSKQETTKEANPVGKLDKATISKEYASWLASKFPNDYSVENAGDIHIDVLSTSAHQFPGLPETFVFYRLLAISAKPNSKAEFSRLLGIAQDNAGNQSTFFDTGFYMPECGDDSDAEISLGEINKIQLNKKQVLVVEKIEQPIVCPGVPTQEKRTALLFFATPPYNKVLELESSYINFHDDYELKQTKPTEFRRSVVYANSCLDFQTKDCYFLAVSSPPKITSYQWNQDMSKLIPIK